MAISVACSWTRADYTWVLEKAAVAARRSVRTFSLCKKNTLVTTAWGKIWKQGPLDAEKDERAILRVDGKLYDRQMIRITERPEVKPVLELLSKKHNLASSPNAVVTGYFGLFRLAPRKNVWGKLTSQRNTLSFNRYRRCGSRKFSQF